MRTASANEGSPRDDFGAECAGESKDESKQSEERRRNEERGRSDRDDGLDETPPAPSARRKTSERETDGKGQKKLKKETRARRISSTSMSSSSEPENERKWEMKRRGAERADTMIQSDSVYQKSKLVIEDDDDETARETAAHLLETKAHAK
ncbi:hypothetical protein PC9H_001607 [Pleurotus ostreatus]|uniref:Uncharacterized protein n=1 Tax=Pleurotus ostreatus TaxID=5322 RepID=A0A8H7A436_PLEOS|nr:uncharacterized protein PC9H_001607 [Pleurotus ostreatus]KAF7441258.1 hypothetical protein PC9H_001607 [Pleurotus ostreatus]